MRDVMTAAGVLLVLGTLARYVGSLLLRAAAFGWFVFAGVGLLLAGRAIRVRGRRWPSLPWASAAGPPGACCIERAVDGGPPRSPRASSPDARRAASASCPRPPSGATHGHARPR